MKARIYRKIAEQGSVTKAELLAAFGLTGSTLTRLLDDIDGEPGLGLEGLGDRAGKVERVVKHQVGGAGGGGYGQNRQTQRKSKRCLYSHLALLLFEKAK